MNNKLLLKYRYEAQEYLKTIREFDKTSDFAIFSACR